MRLAKNRVDQGWTYWASRKGCAHCWAWKGLEGWGGGQIDGSWDRSTGSMVERIWGIWTLEQKREELESL